MHQKVLSQVDIYTDVVKGVEIDRQKIKSDLLLNLVAGKKLSKNKRDYNSQDFKVTFSHPVQWVQDYIRDHFKALHHKSLVPDKEWGNLYSPRESSLSRHQINPWDLKNSPDYTCIYVVDMAKDSCELVIEYDDNRRQHNTWHVSLENNKVVIFPSTQRYFITSNNGSQMNVFLTFTYSYIE